MLKLTNTLTGKKEEFKPIKENNIGMYSCGPTVYDYVHIGNLRSFLLSDILRRVFEYNGYTVKQVMNITDVGQLNPESTGEEEDKMTKGLKREGKPITIPAMRELADFYIARFKDNLEALNILTPHDLPRASEHIEEDIELVKKLIEKGFAYETKSGVYFDTSKDPHYGKLGGLSIDDSHARVANNSEKKNFRDFSLWKFNTKLGYPSPWGQGFPGWHIECSAMSRKYLGEYFDIHTGGIDLAPIHHNNEITQSECAHGHSFVHYWVHNAFLNVEGGKMAKSLGNFLSLQTLFEKNISPLAYRYWLLGGRYNSPMNFSWDALLGAQNTYQKLQARILEIAETGKINETYKKNFIEIVNDDLDTPKALALVWEILADQKLSDGDKKATIIDFDSILGLKLGIQEKIPSKIKKLTDAREQARRDKDFKKSDDLRAEIEKLGYIIKDTNSGPKISKK